MAIPIVPPVAVGTPLEAMTPTVPTPEAPTNVVPVPEQPAVDFKSLEYRKQAENLLDQGALALLQEQNPGFAVAVLARHAGDTPLGNELQQDVLSMLKTGLSKDNPATQTLRNELQQFALPPIPDKSPLIQFLTDHQQEFSEGFEPGQVALAIEAGKMTISKAAIALKGFEPIREAYLQALTGSETGAGAVTAAFQSPAAMLQSVHIEPTAENQQRLAQTIAPQALEQPLQRGINFGNAFMIALVAAEIAIPFVKMVASDESQPGAHH